MRKSKELSLRVCKQCGWANISGLYLRNTDDWIRLCPRCHKAYDTKKKVEVLSYA